MRELLSGDMSTKNKSSSAHSFQNILPIRSKKWRGFRADHYQLGALEVPEHLVTGHQFDVQLGPRHSVVYPSGRAFDGRPFLPGVHDIHSAGHTMRWELE
jgi:hypothetical protein